MTDNKLEGIKAKIRKLFALASDKAASEQEAASAMSMASGLMAKYNIEQGALGVEKPKVKLQRSTEATRDYELTLAQAAGTLYGCRVLSYDGGKKGFSFVGRMDNIDAAMATMMFLVKQVEGLYKAHLPRGLSQPARAEFRRTFKIACASRVYWRAVELMKDPQAMTAVTGGTALVVKGYFDQLEAENQSYLDELGGVRVRTARPKRGGNGTLAGDSAGRSVQLRNSVKASTLALR